MRQESTQEEEARVGLKFSYREGVAKDSPLLVMVHGRAGDRSVMWAFERVVPSAWHIVSFQAFEPDPIGGWSWWHMTENGARRPIIHQAARRLSAAIQAFCQVRRIAPAHLIGIGFSQGGVLISTGTFEGILEFEAIGILAGFVVLPQETGSLKHKPRVFVAHGSEDDIIPVSRARSGVDAMESLGVVVEYVEEPVRHKVGIQGTRALGRWLSELRS